MANGIELVEADTWLYGRLTGDAQLVAELSAADAVWPDAAPDGAQGPLVIYQVQDDGTDLYVVGTTRLWTRATYIVKAVAEGADYDRVAPAAARIDQLLHGAEGAAGTGQVFQCHRVGPFRLPEDTPTVKYRHLGGVYRLLVA